MHLNVLHPAATANICINTPRRKRTSMHPNQKNRRHNNGLTTSTKSPADNFSRDSMETKSKHFFKRAWFPRHTTDYKNTHNGSVNRTHGDSFLGKTFQHQQVQQQQPMRLMTMQEHVQNNRREDGDRDTLYSKKLSPPLTCDHDTFYSRDMAQSVSWTLASPQQSSEHDQNDGSSIWVDDDSDCANYGIDRVISEMHHDRECDGKKPCIGLLESEHTFDVDYSSIGASTYQQQQIRQQWQRLRQEGHTRELKTAQENGLIQQQEQSSQNLSIPRVTCLANHVSDLCSENNNNCDAVQPHLEDMSQQCQTRSLVKSPMCLRQASMQNAQYESPEEHQLEQPNQHHQENRISKWPDDQTWIQDVLDSTKKGNVSPDVFETLMEYIPNLNEQDQPQHPPLHRDGRNSVESWMIDALQTANRGKSYEEVLAMLKENLSPANEEGKAEYEHRESDDDSWLKDAIRFARKEGYTTAALKALVDSVSSDIDPTCTPLQAEESTCISTGSRVADVQQHSSTVDSEMLKMKMDGHDMHSLKHVFCDSRGPLPPVKNITDRYLTSLQANESTSQNGNNAFVIQSKTPVSDLMKVSLSSGDGSSDVEILGELISQLGPDASIESIPDDVLAAFDLTRDQLYRAKYPDMDDLDANKKVPAVKSIYKSSFDTTSQVSDSERKCFYRQMSSPDDEVSWVEDNLRWR